MTPPRRPSQAQRRSSPRRAGQLRTVNLAGRGPRGDGPVQYGASVDTGIADSNTPPAPDSINLRQCGKLARIPVDLFGGLLCQPTRRRVVIERLRYEAPGRV